MVSFQSLSATPTSSPDQARPWFSSGERPLPRDGVVHPEVVAVDDEHPGIGREAEHLAGPNRRLARLGRGGMIIHAASVQGSEGGPRDQSLSYADTIEPLDVAEREGQTILTGTLSGDFIG